jgi:hypothetical protein
MSKAMKSSQKRGADNSGNEAASDEMGGSATQLVDTPAEFISEPTKELGKVMVNDQTPRCPFCSSALIQAVGAATGANAFANMHCSSCHKQFRLSPLQIAKSA